MSEEQKEKLERIACRLRCDIIEMIGAAGSGHPGGSLSAAELLTYLYFEEMRIDPTRPDWPERDRFVLSKGHAAPVLYAALAERGYVDKALLPTLRKLGSPLQGHPDMRKVPGVDMSTGSLGTGFSSSVGMALALELDQSPARVYVLLGDGELQEGQVWEAAMAAAHYGLDRMIAFVDWNGLQIDGYTKDVMNPNPVADKFRAFGWDVQEAAGHDFDAIRTAVKDAQTANNGKPHMIVLKTVKGQGVSFMEDQCGWHGSAPSVEQVAQALQELNKGGVQ